MQPRLLIINCPSTFFMHIPMGTFGICDYLNHQEIPTRILNLALYDMRQISRHLDHYMDEFQPTHVGLILHWQETIEGVLWAGEYVKARNEEIIIICGGFTAGYFAESLLENCSFFDYVVEGDPEKPLELLLKGAEARKIPNLVISSIEGATVCSSMTPRI